MYSSGLLSCCFIFCNICNVDEVVLFGNLGSSSFAFILRNDFEIYLLKEFEKDPFSPFEPDYTLEA